MSYGFEFGRLRSDSVATSFLDSFDHTSGTTNKTYTDDVYGYATGVVCYVNPAYNVTAQTIPEYPTASGYISGNIVSVTVTGGNVPVKVLVFIK